MLNRRLFSIALAGVCCVPCVARAGRLNFDEFSPGANSVLIQSGYGALQWDNFGVMNGSIRKSTEGYHIGTTSPKNIAFNAYGDPAAFSSTNSFNLISANLTAQLANPMNLRVLGFSGGTRIYDRTYVISNTAATTINFDYTGVDRVQFIPPSTTWFALDDLEITGLTGLTNSPPQSTPPGGTVNVGNIEVPTLGHTFNSAMTLFPGFPSARTVNDFLIDQDQSSGGGGLLPVVQIDWETNTQFRLTVSAPAGMKFLVHPPAGQPARFGGFLWWESTRGGISPPGDVTVTFGNLEGTPPNFAASDSVLSHTDGFFGWQDMDSTCFTNALAFTSMTITGTGALWQNGFGTQTFTPHLESRLSIYCATTQITDPGPNLSIVPVGQPLPAALLVVPPDVQLSIQPNGDIVVAFGGRLQSASNPSGPFADVPGNPQGTYTIPKANLSAQQFFRTLNN